MATPEAASTARAIRDFFIASYSKVKHRAPVRGVLGVVAPAQSRRFPGPTSWWGSCCYCTRRRAVSQRNSPAIHTKEENRCHVATLPVGIAQCGADSENNTVSGYFFVSG